MSRKYWMIAAFFTLATTGMAQSTTNQSMPGMMKHDMPAMPSLESMIKRADALVERTEKMTRMTEDTSARDMMMDHGAGRTPEVMAIGLHDMAIGLRSLLRHMDAMHVAGMKMEGTAGAAMMDVHQRLNTVLGELETTLPASDKMHAPPAQKSP